MYECVRPDNTRYTSDSNDGNPRWVPLWTLEYPRPSTRIGGILPPDTSARQPPDHADGRRWFDAGTWIRDECHALPQAEVCARLGDRRDVIRRREFGAADKFLPVDLHIPGCPPRPEALVYDILKLRNMVMAKPDQG